MSEGRFTPTRRWLLAGLAAGATSAAGAALAAPPLRSLRPEARPGGGGARLLPSGRTLVERAKLGAAKVGFYAADAETGAVLDAMNPVLPMPPASVAKALTALYGLDRLGAEHRFATRLIATGPVEGGVLKGDLILAGSGDPTLDTDRLATLAAGLASAGITRIDGAFRLFDGALPPLHEIDPEQPPHVGYNPALSGLNLNFNRVHFEWRRAGAGWDVAMDARSANHRPDVRIARMSVVQRRFPIYTYEAQGDTDRWTVASGALGDNGSRWLPVRRPALYTAEVFGILARSLGVTLPPAEPVATLPAGAEIARVESEDLRAVVRDMLKYSTNLTAEAVGLSASVQGGGRPETLAESAAAMSGWLGARIGSHRPALVDHSGLGGASRITARDMVRALVLIGPGQQVEPLLKPIPMKDEKGRPQPDHPVTIHAKTGTLNFVSALAGYAQAPGGRKIAFATFVADIPRRDALTPEQRERPEGGRNWAGRARLLQLRLIERWSALTTA